MKKFLLFLTITLILCGAVFSIYMEYIYITTYPVFVESYDHGTVSINVGGAEGDDSKYKVVCEKDTQITININPERTDSTYYNLKKLLINGEDVTSQVKMLQYTTTVTQKLTIIATFEEGERPDDDPQPVTLDVTAPEIEKYAENSYLGSYAAYNLKDPTVFYDSQSGYYYCFGSDNVVIKSTDLVNWTGRTTYFKHPESAATNTLMSFSQFESVSEWAYEHGYGSDENYSDKNQNRCPSSPEIVKVGSTYYFYYSIIKEENANEAAIFCVKTDNLEKAIENKEWTDVGLVISTCGTVGGTTVTIDEQGNETEKVIAPEYDVACACHPSVLYDNEKLYMVYGGYYAGGSLGGEIYLVELDAQTGLLLENSTLSSAGSTVSTMHGSESFKTGTLIANPGRVPAMEASDGSLVSGAEIIYNNDTGYYYLFVTYGYEQTNYSIVVSRSARIEGPYTDFNSNNMAEYSQTSMYSKGYLLLGGYNFINSSKGSVSYTDVGRASIGSPNIIKTDSGNWYIASQSQIYYKVGDEILTGSQIAEENSLMLNSAPSLEIRRMLWSEDGWPLAMPEVYAGKSAEQEIEISSLYGNWDVIIFSHNPDSENAKAVSKSNSSVISILDGTVISQKDISNGNPINYGGSFEKSGDGYTVVIDGVTYTVYPMIVWDWELKEGSIVFTGIGDNGSAIWGKKKLSTTLGLYTAAFYHVYSKCEGELAEVYTQKTEQFSINPSQAQIDRCVSEMLEDLKP